MTFHLLSNKMDDHPILLNGIVDELQKKGNYEPIFVRDFAPIDRQKRYMYIKQLEKGLPVRCVMVTKSFGSSIGNYHYIWKIPPRVTLENALAENQQVVRSILDELPKYHTRCMRREFMNKFGLISPSTKPFVLREIYKELTSECLSYHTRTLNFIRTCTHIFTHIYTDSLTNTHMHIHSPQTHSRYTQLSNNVHTHNSTTSALAHTCLDTHTHTH